MEKITKNNHNNSLFVQRSFTLQYCIILFLLLFIHFLTFYFTFLCKPCLGPAPSRQPRARAVVYLARSDPDPLGAPPLSSASPRHWLQPQAAGTRASIVILRRPKAKHLALSFFFFFYKVFRF